MSSHGSPLDGPPTDAWKQRVVHRLNDVIQTLRIIPKGYSSNNISQVRRLRVKARQKHLLAVERQLPELEALAERARNFTARSIDEILEALKEMDVSRLSTRERRAASIVHQSGKSAARAYLAVVAMVLENITADQELERQGDLHAEPPTSEPKRRRRRLPERPVLTVVPDEDDGQPKQRRRRVQNKD